MAGINNFQELGKAMSFDSNYIEPKRGEIYYVDLSDMGVGTIHIAQKKRPALIIQNDVGNKFSSTVIVALITSSIPKKLYPMQFPFILNEKSSIIMFEQIMTLDKNRLDDKIGELTYDQMRIAEEKLMYSLQLNKFSLENIKGIEVISQNTTKSKSGTYVNFDIELDFEGQPKQKVNIRLDKLKEFDSTIEVDIEFDTLQEKLDCIKGLHWLVTNNQI